MGRINSDAVGATTTPPITTPVAGRQKILTKPLRRPLILARGLVESGSITVRAGYSPTSIACCETPTVAISGRVKIAEATVFSLIGLTPSPSEWYIAMRPCMAATEASGNNPVQSPAA
ncbi:Uncharacterised protein [Mycobacteroides abscessus subsp. abscessus]|nr:Uncharacterised protein [Mycobacteroides abscessus subsp. abscessus]